MADLTADERFAVVAAFDHDYYLANSPDLLEAGMDPLMHFLDFGWRELRNPSVFFDTAYYLQENPDIAAADINPFVHYILWGQAEGRLGSASASSDPSLRQVLGLTQAELQNSREAFDEEFYFSNNPDLQDSNLDLFAHFMVSGWQELRDPSPAFSVQFYLDNNPDIAESGSNPFVHWVNYGSFEGRAGLSFQGRMRNKVYEPLVSVIVPNYNHAKYLKQRIDSILGQTYQNIEILLLDDCSKDNSRKVLESYVISHPEKVRALFNDRNSGGVFAQWQKGLLNVSGELIWICESDDFCASDFLENAIQPFRDESVMVSFGRILFADGKGKFLDGLDQYREQAEPGIWDDTVVRPAAEWFRDTFAVSNIIPNVGGCVFRQQPIDQAVWKDLVSYKISGDWYLYCMLAGGGQIAYVPTAVAYFRQHDKNTSGVSGRGAAYYQEHERLITFFRKRWGTPDDVAARCFQNVYRQYVHAKAAKTHGPLTKLYSNDRVMAAERVTPHVLIAFLGFHLGGGELFPIHLANTLIRDGITVSVMCLDSNNENPDIRSMLDRRIAVYDAELVAEMGMNSFVQRAGIDLIHSHSAGIEFCCFDRHRLEKGTPYVVSLHGSYEVTPVPDDLLTRLLRGVKHWVYLSEKNLVHLEDIPVDRKKLTRIPNGMPDDERPAPFSRADFEIGEQDLVIAIASRAIAPKGWREAIAAVQEVSRDSTVGVHLVLCGSGPLLDDLKAEVEDSQNIHIVGFQDRINGIYRMADVVMLPTRFAGESFPLTLIQAMQVGRPIIATDIGEIKSMITPTNAEPAGIVVPHTDDDQAFIKSLTDAILTMLDPMQRSTFAANSLELGMPYGMATVMDRYLAVYGDVLPELFEATSEERVLEAAPL